MDHKLFPSLSDVFTDHPDLVAVAIDEGHGVDRDPGAVVSDRELPRSWCARRQAPRGPFTSTS